MIEVTNLTKIYGDHKAVDNLTFTVEDGRIYGFLGPNGAGKSTTMNIITGCLAATEGKVKIGGYDIFEEPRQAKKLIGYLPEIPPVYPDKNIDEYLTFVARAKGVPEKGIKAEVERCMAATKITGYRKRLIKNLSKGYRQRVGIAQALLGDPKLIILDEPTVGLDPQQIIEIRELIFGLKDNHTVIISSHILSEIQAVCQDILIIAHGKVVACDTTENLERQYEGPAVITIVCDGKKAELEKVIQEIASDAETVYDETADGYPRVIVTLQSEDDREFCRLVSNKLVEKKMAVLEMSTKRATLEDIFIELTREAEYQREASKEDEENAEGQEGEE